ncbi:hypothetical protein RRG08_040779 [Elysia crispata]|uniref:Uncharacterized protein n=1 Tax=Elysia crispata TaxID=231223 RepID=A0AAE1EF06_9GAST|nr:hypothetical protein RRG08_040779 [Elysia crispata]
MSPCWAPHTVVCVIMCHFAILVILFVPSAEEKDISFATPDDGVFLVTAERSSTKPLKAVPNSLGTFHARLPSADEAANCIAMGTVSDAVVFYRRWLHRPGSQNLRPCGFLSSLATPTRQPKPAEAFLDHLETVKRLPHNLAVGVYNISFPVGISALSLSKKCQPDTADMGYLEEACDRGDI